MTKKSIMNSDPPPQPYLAYSVKYWKKNLIDSVEKSNKIVCVMCEKIILTRIKQYPSFFKLNCCSLTNISKDELRLLDQEPRLNKCYPIQGVYMFPVVISLFVTVVSGR